MANLATQRHADRVIVCKAHDKQVHICSSQVQYLQQLCPDLTEEEAQRALDLCHGRYCAADHTARPIA